MSPFAKLCVVFLVLTQNVSCVREVGFKLEDSHLEATEGSCIEIKCSIFKSVNSNGAYWFWMKDAKWNKESSDFDATVVYSTSNKSLPVSPDFTGRVTYTGSENWHSYPSSKNCSIKICELKKTDSGNYSIRYVRNLSSLKWKTETEVNLTVKENLCPITFEKPPPLKESQKVTLTCLTLSSCPLNPHITSPVNVNPSTHPDPQSKATQKSTTVSFNVSWQNDGEEFSCQTQDNEDPYLIKNISLTVEYDPRDIQAAMSRTDVREKQTLTLTCSGKGSPAPTFTWFRNNQSAHEGPEWKIYSIKDSQSGDYYCKAVNTYGTKSSNILFVDVQYEPEVVANITSPNINITEGDKITFTCEVKRSNPQPQPHDFYWHINQNTAPGKSFSIESIRSDQSGSYSCRAENTVGIGMSPSHEINVHYRPRKARISTQGHQAEVKVGSSLTFDCNTAAYPAPQRYSWYRYSQPTWILSDWKPEYVSENHATLRSVQRADEACYACNATNYIGTGSSSDPLCIRVRYAPTKPVLSVDPEVVEVVEGWLITFRCSVESYPTSTLTLKKTSLTDPRSVEERNSFEPSNDIYHTFTVKSTHSGSYTCEANNGEGSEISAQRKLVVKYVPKDVVVEARPGLVVKENIKITLLCQATSYPIVTSVFWTKVTDGKTEIISHEQQIILPGRPSDRGLYSCSATNEIGIGNSTQAKVEVQYAPKVTNVIKGAERQHSNGKRYVTLSCSSQSNPPIREYSWYKKTTEDRTIRVSGNQNYTVDSDHPGFYYCIAKNELNEKMSDPVQLFVDRGLMKYVLIVVILLLVIFLLILVYRHRRRKSIQRGATNTSSCFGFLGRLNRPRKRNLMNEPVMAEPFRSRDDLLPDQRCRPNARQSQPPPDSTPASNINTVYSTVSLPAGKQGPSAQKPIKQQGGQAEGESLNYASLHFEKKPKKKKAKVEESIVYAVVSKQKSPKEKQQEIVGDYENVNAVNGVRSPNPMNYDTDTSEEEVELNYAQVSFKAKPGHQRAGGPSNNDTSSETSSDTSSDSSTSDEDERTQYSQVKV